MPRTGVIPRAARALFEKLNPQPVLNRNGSGIRTPNRYSMSALSNLNGTKPAVGTDRNWQLRATYVEVCILGYLMAIIDSNCPQIYNEQLRDLLVPEAVPAHERGTVAIREDAKGRILLTGLHQVAIDSIEDLLSALNFGSTIRQTDSTAINAKSSRSHAVFSLNLVQRKTNSPDKSARDKRLSMPLESVGGVESWVTVDSKLHFVDLAGSERLKNTGASGERAKEGISINAGLASLGKVISQLSARQAGTHISYRDSKLTRLLQDSLGGNAITYMIACITPAEFHLSETLNTVQYAQRARAIQSKPKIQQFSDENDKQALIDRLRAEVSFLRDQVRNAERDRAGNTPQDRQNEREIELQNHLLDIQENYSALSQRHAKLISEITQARDDESRGIDSLVGTPGESAAARLQRSTSFADAVEQVVLEYEKTIQSLETSLSNTRASLSSTESSLLERETKCACVETLNQKLQGRIQKLIDHESSTKQYVHDLEAKLDGRVVGEEKSTVVVVELRKEISRLRENENTTEEYIATLEERLADADQDSELMHREIARLEHVVERQRSVGKLDNLLYELDHVQLKDTKDDKNKVLTNGVSKVLHPTNGQDRKISNATLKVATETPIPDSDDEERGEHPPAISPESYLQNPAQSRFVQEKLSTVNQELFDLRVEHESTVNEFDLLSAKYEEALRTLATLQESMDQSRRTPASPSAFLADARVNELKNAGQSSSSRSLSLELSSAGELPAIAEPEDASADTPETPSESDRIRTPAGSDSPDDIGDPRTLNVEKDEGMSVLQAKYDELCEEHSDALDLVEELKAEVQRARMSSPPSPTLLIRRKSSQIMTIDRAHRSLASLGNIAAENFADKPEIKDSFELNLNAVMHELHQRSERVQVLEGEVAAAKKEMETKMTIISGLTRERSSLKASSPVDMSMLSSMRDQILQSEHQLKILQQLSASREEELVKEIDALKRTVSVPTDSSHLAMPGALPETPALEQTTERRELDLKVSELEAQISQWESKHQTALESMQTSEKEMISTITELQQNLANVDLVRQAKVSELDSLANSMAAAAAAFDLERQKHQDIVTSLHQELEQHRSAIAEYANQVSDLQQSQFAARQEIEAANDFRQKTQKHLDEHHDQILALEKQLVEHQAAVEFHKHGLKSLHDSHASDLEETLRQATEDSDAHIAEITTAHEKERTELEQRVNDLENQLKEHQAAIEEHRRQVEERGAQINNLEKENQSHSRSASDATDGLREAQTKLKLAEVAQVNAQASLTKAQARVEELSRAKSELDEELVDLREKEQRASRLVEELEGQLSSTFEDSRNATSRLSLMQSTRDQELAEARAAAIKAQEEVTMLRHRIEQIDVRFSQNIQIPT